MLRKTAKKLAVFSFYGQSLIKKALEVDYGIYIDNKHCFVVNFWLKSEDFNKNGLILND